MRLGEQIRRPVKIDQATDFANIGKFARMCVEVDFTKPFTGKFMSKNKYHKIVNEGIHLICFNCGMQGYNKESCPNLKHDDQGVSVEERASMPQ